jgi:hypothetical protein
VLAASGGACGSTDSPTTSERASDASTNYGDGAVGPSNDSAAPADASACQPGDVSTFKATWKPPAPFYQGACNAPRDQAHRYNSECLGGGGQGGCSSFTDAVNGADYKCGQCIAAAETADHVGPLVVHKGWVELNIAGCVANAMNDPTGVRCSAGAQAARACELAACGANCPVSSKATLDAFDRCATQADTTVCGAYAQQAQCVAKIDAGASTPLGKCLESLSFENHFADLVELFCGPGPDAAPPPPVDAGADQG